MPRNFESTELIGGRDAKDLGCSLIGRSLPTDANVLVQMTEKGNLLETKFYSPEGGIGEILRFWDGSTKPQEVVTILPGNVMTIRGTRRDITYRRDNSKVDATERIIEKANGNKRSTKKRYYRNGAIHSIVNRTFLPSPSYARLLDGKNTTFYSNGKKKLSANYRRHKSYSVVDGMYISYKKTGEVDSKTTVKNGKLQGWKIVYSGDRISHALKYKGSELIKSFYPAHYGQDDISYKDELLAKKMLEGCGQNRDTFLGLMLDAGFSGAVTNLIYNKYAKNR